MPKISFPEILSSWSSVAIERGYIVKNERLAAIASGNSCVNVTIDFQRGRFFDFVISGVLDYRIDYISNILKQAVPIKGVSDASAIALAVERVISGDFEKKFGFNSVEEGIGRVEYWWSEVDNSARKMLSTLDDPASALDLFVRNEDAGGVLNAIYVSILSIVNGDRVVLPKRYETESPIEKQFGEWLAKEGGAEAVMRIYRGRTRTA